MKKILFPSIFLLICTSFPILGQEAAWSNNDFEKLDQAEYYFTNELYGQARETLEQYFEEDRSTNQSVLSQTKFTRAKVLYTISGLRLKVAEGLSELKAFVDFNYADPQAKDAVFELGNHYYNTKDYEYCIKYLNYLDIDNLEEDEMSEVVFKRGYCHFVRKEFQEAQYEFSYSKDIQNDYFYPINYYYGMSEYFTDDYEGAVKSFKRVEGSQEYKDHVPYYLSQIYFATEEYDQLITYGESVIDQPGIKKVKEIRKLLGQTYFLQGNYRSALPHLVFYEQNTGQLTVDEFYQLAFTQYQLNLYEDAIPNFLELTNQDSEMGQLANYYLADCYEKTNQLQSARAAFKKVSQMSYSISMQEEALFNYGKLSAQMDYEREAINVLLTVKQSSPYYEESQVIINDILVNTGDYANAISIIESLPTLTEDLKATYQQATFKYGLQKLNDGNYQAARTQFIKSLKYPKNDGYTAQTNYWMGYMEHDEGNYPVSIQEINQYFNKIQNAGQVPDEAKPFMAHYLQAYNFLKQEKYEDAVEQYKQTIAGIKSQQIISNPIIVSNTLPDAYMRAGDCLFKLRRYDEAVSYYDQAIIRKQGEFVYAMYQRGLIEGLLGKPYEKILTLEELVTKHPRSEYADDALAQIGDTYLILGNPIQSAAAFKKILDDYKGRTHLTNTANLKLGLINYNEGDMEGALSYYKNVFKNNPRPKESQEALIAIEEIYIDDLGKSEEYFKFLESVPGYEISAFEKDSINYKVGEIQFNNGKYDKAISSFTDYLKVYPKGYYYLPAHYHRGESLTLLKLYNEALADYESIIEVGFSKYYENSVKKAAIISYNHNQDFTKSLNYYQKWEATTENKPDKFEAQLGALRSAFRISDAQAVEKYSGLVTVNELATDENKSTAQYYLGKTLYANKKLDGAFEAFDNVQKLSNNYQAAESRYMKAKILSDQSKLDEAKKAANDANKSNANYPFWIAKSILLLADIYIVEEDLLNARAAAEAVVENFKSDQSLVDEANEKLELISKLEELKSRIKEQNTSETIELDTIGN